MRVICIDDSPTIHGAPSKVERFKTYDISDTEWKSPSELAGVRHPVSGEYVGFMRKVRFKPEPKVKPENAVLMCCVDAGTNTRISTGTLYMIEDIQGTRMCRVTTLDGKCLGNYFASRFERPAAIDPNTAMIARDGLPKAAQCVMDNFAIETKRVLPAFPGIIAWR